MKPPKINLLDPGAAQPARRRFSFWKGAAVGLSALVIIVPTLFSIASIRLIRAASSLNPDADAPKTSFIETVRRLVGTSEKALRGEEKDRINLLVLGEGGAGHEGPHLTDTMLFVTFQPSTSNVAILSLPRDLWVPLPGMGNGKLNGANAWAEKDKPGSGGAYAARTVSELLDQPIDYYVRVDFSAFTTLIDDVGGVSVNVEKTFTDYSYPTNDNLYQKVSFEKGWQTLNGERALQYVRSRHGNNGEGSDFARSRRQQQVILALKEKLVSFDTLLNPSRIASVLETLQSHVITDMELWEIVKLAKALRGVNRDELVHRVLDDRPDGPLYATSIPLQGVDAYVLLPRASDWSEVRRIAANVLDPDGTPGGALILAGDKAPEPPIKIEVLNGTRQSGLAKKTQDLLDKVGYEVVKIGNHADQEQDATVIYDLTNGSRPEALERLRHLLNAEVSLTLPGFLASGVTPSNLALSNGDQPQGAKGTDFIVVLGKNGS